MPLRVLRGWLHYDGVAVSDDLLMGAIERRAGAPTERVRATRIPERLGHEGEHRVEDLASKRGRGGVVEIDRHRADCTSGLRLALPPATARTTALERVGTPPRYTVAQPEIRVASVS